MIVQFRAILALLYFISAFGVQAKPSEANLREALYEYYVKASRQYLAASDKEYAEAHENYKEQVVKPIKAKDRQVADQRVDVLNIKLLRSLVRDALTDPVAMEKAVPNLQEAIFEKGLRDSAVALDSDFKQVLKLSLKEPAILQDFKNLSDIIDQKLVSAEAKLAASESEMASLRELQKQHRASLQSLIFPIYFSRL